MSQHGDVDSNRQGCGTWDGVAGGCEASGPAHLPGGTSPQPLRWQQAGCVVLTSEGHSAPVADPCSPWLLQPRESYVPHLQPHGGAGRDAQEGGAGGSGRSASAPFLDSVNNASFK